jgi:hypothetical protein
MLARIGTPTALRNSVYCPTPSRPRRRSCPRRRQHTPAPAQLRGQPLVRQRVRPRHQHKLLIGPRVHGSLDAVHHLAAGTSSLPGRWPQRFWPTWSSMCTAAAPALIIDRMVRAMLNARPSRCRCRPERQPGSIRDSPHVDQHIFHGADAQVGIPASWPPRRRPRDRARGTPSLQPCAPCKR